MAELTPVSITKDGTNLTTDLVPADGALTDQVRIAQNLLVVVRNGDVAAKTVTVSSPVSEALASGYGQVTISDLVYNVNAGEDVFFTIPSGYGNNNFFTWTYDDVTNVSVGVFSLAPEA